MYNKTAADTAFSYLVLR